MLHRLNLSVAALFAPVAVAAAASFPFFDPSNPLGGLTPLPIFVHPLYVENAPQSAVPYLTTAHSHLQGVALGPDIFRFAATKNSTGNAFTVVLSATTGSSIVGWSTTPHFHQRHFETFYPIKGRMQLWADDQSRLLTPGDLGVVPENHTHVFEVLDPDTYFVGVQAPGGFEDFFFIIGEPVKNDPLDAPYNPNIPAGPPINPPPQAYGILENVGDFWPVNNYTPNNNLVNGSAPPSGWHVADNAPAVPHATTPYFMARGWGPYFLHSTNGLYQVISPLVTQNATPVGNETPFTLSTLTLSLPLGSTQGDSTKGATRLPNGWFTDAAGGNSTAAIDYAGVNAKTSTSLPAASYFFVEEGRFVLTIEGAPAALLTSGDSAFVPPNTTFSYYGLGPFTKVLYASGGAIGGLDEMLLKDGAAAWHSPVFPMS